MIYILDKNIWREGKEATIRTELGQVVLRLESKSFSLGSKITIFDRYHVPIGLISKKVFSRFHFDIMYDEQVVATLNKKRFFFSKRTSLVTDNGISFKVKGNIQDLEYQFVRKSKSYAKVSKQYANKDHQYGVETQDEKMKYSFLCAAVILSMR